MNPKTRLNLSMVVLVAAGAKASAQTPLGTEFTYQGQLKEFDAPLNDTADFEFRLFDDPSGGVQVGSTNPVSDVDVVDGLFTVSLDFGSAAFNGDQRWLDVRVRSPAGGGNFATLTPRQPLTATPFALYALSGPGSGGPWALSGNNVFSTNTGNVGIATSEPHHRLRIEQGPFWTANQWAGSLELENAGAIGWHKNAGGQAFGIGHSDGGFHFFRTDSDPGTGAFPATYLMTIGDNGNVGIGTTTPQSELHVSGGAAVFDNPGGAIRVTKTLGQLNNDDLGIWNRGGNGGQPFAIADWQTGSKGIFVNTASGNVGIGTASPAAKLDVRGDIRLGSSGQFFAPAGGENLRIIRGDVRGDGVILRGAGFTCQRITDGVYEIAFSPLFASAPSITATAHKSAAPDRIATQLLLANNLARIFTRIPGDGSGTDTDFSICVIGPR